MKKHYLVSAILDSLSNFGFVSLKRSEFIVNRSNSNVIKSVSRMAKYARKTYYLNFSYCSEFIYVSLSVVDGPAFYFVIKTSSIINKFEFRDFFDFVLSFNSFPVGRNYTFVTFRTVYVSD